MELTFGILGFLGGILCAVGDILKVPFYILYTFLVILSSILAGYAIVRRYLQIPVWTICLTPLYLMIIGMTLRKIKKSWFNDLPGIIMPSMGLAMLGLLAVINYII